MFNSTKLWSPYSYQSTFDLVCIVTITMWCGLFHNLMWTSLFEADNNTDLIGVKFLQTYTFVQPPFPLKLFQSSYLCSISLRFIDSSLSFAFLCSSLPHVFLKIWIINYWLANVQILRTFCNNNYFNARK